MSKSLEEMCIMRDCAYYPNDIERTIRELIAWEISVHDFFKPSYTIIDGYIVEKLKVPYFLNVDNPSDYAVCKLDKSTHVYFKDYTLEKAT